jgi:hypothetical protein
LLVYKQTTHSGYDTDAEPAQMGTGIGTDGGAEPSVPARRARRRCAVLSSRRGEQFFLRLVLDVDIDAGRPPPRARVADRQTDDIFIFYVTNALQVRSRTSVRSAAEDERDLRVHGKYAAVPAAL